MRNKFWVVAAFGVLALLVFLGWWWGRGPESASTASASPIPFATPPRISMEVDAQHVRRPGPSPRPAEGATPVIGAPTASAPNETPAKVQISGPRGTESVFVNPRGETARIYTKPGKTVTARLVFPEGTAGEPVRVEMLDGGSLPNRTPGQLLHLDGDLGVAVSAKISANEGIHRVRVFRGSQAVQLNYWAGPENTYAEITPSSP